jgi:hypothetical protein
MCTGIVEKFILNHYYDLYDSLERYKGIYICDNLKCNYKQMHKLEVSDTMPCPTKNCNGRLYLHVGLKEYIEKICLSKKSVQEQKPNMTIDNIVK